MGIWHKIVYTLWILFIASLQLAKPIIIPNQSSWTIMIVGNTCSVGNFPYKSYNAFASFDCFIFLNVYIPIMRLFSSFSFQKRASQYFCNLWAAFLFHERMPMVHTFYQYMVAFFSHNRRSISDILIDHTNKHDQRVFLKSFGYVTNFTQLWYQSFVMDPDKKTNIIYGI